MVSQCDHTQCPFLMLIQQLEESDDDDDDKEERNRNLELSVTQGIEQQMAQIMEKKRQEREV